MARESGLAVAVAAERVRQHEKTPFTNRCAAPVTGGKQAAGPASGGGRRRKAARVATVGCNPVALTAEFTTTLQFALAAQRSARAMHALVHEPGCRGAAINNYFRPGSCPATTKCNNCDRCGVDTSSAWKNVQLSKLETAELCHGLCKLRREGRCTHKDIVTCTVKDINEKRMTSLAKTKVDWAIDDLVASGWLVLRARCEWRSGKNMGRKAESLVAAVHDGATVVCGVCSKDVHHEHDIADRPGPTGGSGRTSDRTDQSVAGTEGGLAQWLPLFVLRDGAGGKSTSKSAEKK